MLAVQRHRKPRHYDRNLIVIGAGSGGLVAALIAAATRARVSLVEQHRMGGDCLNTGCVPSKTLIQSASVAHMLRTGHRFGIKNIDYRIDFENIMRRIHRTIQTISVHDSVERFSRLGVDCIHGRATLLSPWRVAVAGQELSTRRIIIATGASPIIPDIPGLQATAPLHSDNFWELSQQPRRLLVLGGGPIGCELAQAMARLGSHVVLVEKANRLLLREDEDVSALLAKRFADERIEVRTGHCAQRFVRDGKGWQVCLEHAGRTEQLGFDRVLLALGRKPNTSGFGLEELGVALRADRSIAVDRCMRSSVSSIYACGDVTGPFQFTHAASHQAWYATFNALFGGLRSLRVDYSALPWATFCDPEIARVGLNEQEAKAQGIDYECTVLPLCEVERAVIAGETEGMIKVLTLPGKDRLLGATIVGPHAGELIMEYVTALRHGHGLNHILGTIHIYPTLSELNKLLAGKWRRGHIPEWLPRWLGRYHAFRLGKAAGSGNPGP